MLNKNHFNKVFFYILLSIFLFTQSCIYCRNNNDFKEKQKNEHTVKDLIKLIAYKQIHKIEDGEYKRGDWETVVKSRPPEGIKWKYAVGVTMYALLRAFDILKDENIIDFVTKYNRITANQYAYLRWQRETFGKYENVAGMQRLMNLRMLDDCGSMTSQMLEGILNHNFKITPEMSELIDIVDNYLLKVQDRLPDGTLWRPTIPEIAIWTNDWIWADDLYMCCPCLVRLSKFRNNKSYLNDAVKQILNYASYLQDSDGLWFHGYFVNEKKTSPYKWGRANGWVLVATVEVLSAMPEDHFQYEDVLNIMRKHIEGLKTNQSETGFWRQVLDHTELWDETSCTAMFTYAIARAINRNWVDRSYIEVVKKSVNGLKTRITERGEIEGVVMGTGIASDLKYYSEREIIFDDTHGNGTVLLALTEFYDLMKNVLKVENF